MDEVALWQYRWTNPAGDTNTTPDMLAWKEVKPRDAIQTLEQRLDELRGYRFDGKPSYELRALGVIAPVAQEDAHPSTGGMPREQVR